MGARAELCDECPMRRRSRGACNEPCPALMELWALDAARDLASRKARIAALAGRVGRIDAEPSRDLRALGERLLRDEPLLSDVRGYGWQIGYVMSREAPAGERPKLADCRRVPLTYRAWLPFDFVVTFYEPNITWLSEEQREVLMIHELLHVGITDKGKPKLVKHDVQDFRALLERYGLGWADFGGLNGPTADALREDDLDGEEDDGA